jgi:Protein of unknown function (DUF2846)
LTGCMTQSGTDYATVAQKVGPPKPGHSRVLVLQEQRKGLSMAFCQCDMKVDGAPMGKVAPGTYVYADVPAGRHELTANEVLFPGETRREFVTQAGRTYYFVMKTSERHDAVTGGALIGGIVGAVAVSAVSSGSQNTGPVDLFALDESAAKATLAELQLAQ